VGTLSFCRSNIQGEQVAQVACRSISVKVVVVVRTYFRSPVGPKRSVFDHAVSNAGSRQQASSGFNE
jgi:hypothetical protein